MATMESKFEALKNAFNTHKDESVRTSEATKLALNNSIDGLTKKMSLELQVMLTLLM